MMTQKKQAATPKKRRSRQGYVMVHLSPEQRTKLDRIARSDAKSSGSLKPAAAAVFRRWLDAADDPGE